MRLSCKSLILPSWLPSCLFTRRRGRGAISLGIWRHLYTIWYRSGDKSMGSSREQAIEILAQDNPIHIFNSRSFSLSPHHLSDPGLSLFIYDLFLIA
jgi:hypothetical protein